MEAEQGGTEGTGAEPERVDRVPPPWASKTYQAFCLDKECRWHDLDGDGNPWCLDEYSARSRGQMHGDSTGHNWDVREC